MLGWVRVLDGRMDFRLRRRVSYTFFADGASPSIGVTTRTCPFVSGAINTNDTDIMDQIFGAHLCAGDESFRILTRISSFPAIAGMIVVRFWQHVEPWSLPGFSLVLEGTAVSLTAT
jgi:hypothetical protein